MIPKSLEDWFDSNDKIIGEKSLVQKIKDRIEEEDRAELAQIQLTE